MKKNLLFLILYFSLGVKAQQFSFQMYFKDAIGNRDTLTLGYDTAATKIIDAAFGEVNIIGVPLDSIFEVRITDESVWGGQQQGTFHTKKQITYYNCDSPLYNIQSIDIKAKHWPVTATWNKAIFNDSCRDWSYFSSFIGDLGGSSNLGMARLANKDSVIFTTNADPGWFGFFYYVNNANDTISVFMGKAGSGKTLLATQIALEYLFYREVDRIVITRPTVSNEDLGFLPGNIKEKMDPWLSPIQANMTMLSGKEKIDKLVQEDKIEIAPISFLRGRTFVNSCVIVDESQNVTKSQMEMILSRLGVNSKMILTGDANQIDLKQKKDSGLPYLFNMKGKIEGLGVYELKTNHRHPIVDDILQYFEDNKSEK